MKTVYKFIEPNWTRAYQFIKFGNALDILSNNIWDDVNNKIKVPIWDYISGT